jgi:hypothetical protein
MDSVGMPLSTWLLAICGIYSPFVNPLHFPDFTFFL